MIFSALLTVLGLSLFETISSVDNAIINAEVLSTMGARARKWFLTWGILIAVFLVRGFLPFFIIWGFNPTLSISQILSAAWSIGPDSLGGWRGIPAFSFFALAFSGRQAFGFAEGGEIFPGAGRLVLRGGFRPARAYLLVCSTAE